MEVAGGDEAAAGGVRFRPVTIVNAGARKVLDLRVEVPVEDMAKLGEIQEIPSGPAKPGAEAHIDLAKYSPATAGDHSRADFDADFCECAEGGGAACGGAERPGG